MVIRPIALYLPNADTRFERDVDLVSFLPINLPSQPEASTSGCFKFIANA